MTSHQTQSIHTPISKKPVTAERMKMGLNALKTMVNDDIYAEVLKEIEDADNRECSRPIWARTPGSGAMWNRLVKNHRRDTFLEKLHCCVCKEPLASTAYDNNRIALTQYATSKIDWDVHKRSKPFATSGQGKTTSTDKTGKLEVEKDHFSEFVPKTATISSSTRILRDMEKVSNTCKSIQRQKFNLDKLLKQKPYTEEIKEEIHETSKDILKLQDQISMEGCCSSICLQQKRAKASMKTSPNYSTLSLVAPTIPIKYVFFIKRTVKGYKVVLM